MVCDIPHTKERLVSDSGDGIGDGDAGEAAATRERRVSDSGDGIGDSDAGEAFAIIERLASDSGDGIGDGDAGEASAINERIVSDSGNGISPAAIGHGGGDGEAAGRPGIVRARSIRACYAHRVGQRTRGDGVVECLARGGDGIEAVVFPLSTGGGEAQEGEEGEERC